MYILASANKEKGVRFIFRPPHTINRSEDFSP
jgi:hypothetical protein